ncbi:putative leucine-rich repeat-containing protein DDB_G0290503 [Zerene cesonia]|uniref:putative leucine-rich repeat-containing protein DDB_G0290503 n=1 Tax=Zerene cesonia TaxID=33412 RepID=UPI0018E50DDD|nr:putative leucine-rich repeat-containing protein DDB_G0290503 [Zerene cesonia]XP_038217322.1 putative leucine-rich repeat-containing protein DDB_G0290503 [Zerene cesonia]
MMSGLQTRGDDPINGVDVREQGSALRVATNTPHLVSLGTGRLSTAVTLHPIKQGRVTIGSDPTCDIYVVGTGVASVHCRVENSHGVVTLYPVSGSTLLDGLPVDKPTRLSQGSMLTIGRSNYLRFNHPEEAKLMKSVLPSGHVSMAPVQFTPNEQCLPPGYVNHADPNQCYQNTSISKIYKDNSLSQLDQELDVTLKEMSRKPPTVPRKPYKDLDASESNSDQESKPKIGSIMAKVSKFEYYAKQQKIGRSQFYTSNENEISPKVFSSNSLTVNTPARDVLGGRNIPNYMNKLKDQKIIVLNENNSLDPKNCSYANVAVRKTKIDDIVRNFDDTRTEKLKKVNNDQQQSRPDNHIYGKINVDRRDVKNDSDAFRNNYRNQDPYQKLKNSDSSYRNQDYKNQEPPHSLQNSYQQDSCQRLQDSYHSVQDSCQRMQDSCNSMQDSYHSVQESCQRLQESYQSQQDSCQRMQDSYHSVQEPCQRLQESYHSQQDSCQSMQDSCHSMQDSCHNIQGSCQSTQDSYKSLEVSSGDMEYTRNEYARIDMKNILPSSTFDRNPQYSPVYTNYGYDRSFEAENRRKQAYQDRLKEEEQKEAESARLEEILNMCAEYERQISSGIPITPTEKRSHNKIITNGSLPRSVVVNNPNFVQTSDGYYKFDTSQNKNNIMSQSLPIQRNLSSYENFDTSQNALMNPSTPEITISDNNYENVGRMDEIGIPVFDDVQRNDLSSPIMIRKLQNGPKLNSPIGSPYENVYFKNNLGFKPKSPNTQSPRTRIKTTFAHKNIPSPQYFIFPTPPPTSTNPFEAQNQNDRNQTQANDVDDKTCTGIEKQLSLEEEIPMIDDSDVTNDIEFRYSKIIKDDPESEANLTKNKSFDDVKNELMADIPELEKFEEDLKNNRENVIKNIRDEFKKIDLEADSIDSVLEDNVDELKSKYETLKEERKKLVGEIHEIKCKMTEIRSQEDDILRELEMEKALIKGEYDSEIAILNIEQKKKAELADKAKQIEEEIRQMKERQETRQNEMRDRVEIATMKVERIEKDMKDNSATLEELQNAQDILDNETKIYEDLEFQYLEEESELLSNREDVQNEIMLLSKKIDAQKTRILTLKSEANNNLTSALEETKILQAEYVRLLNQVEELTGKVQNIEKEMKPIVSKLNYIERTQSPDSAFYTDQTRAKSGEFGYSPSSDSDDNDVAKLSNFEDHTKQLKDKFNSIDQMSQSMIVDIERRVTSDAIDPIDVDDKYNESPSKSSTSSKEKKGFWERNFDSLKRKNKDKKKTEKVDLMSQSLNENMFYNDNIEVDTSLDKFNSLRHSKKKDKKENGPVKSSSSSKIPTFAALGKIIKKDSLKRKESANKNSEDSENIKNRYVKNSKSTQSDNKYVKAKSLSPDKKEQSIKEENEDECRNVTFDSKIKPDKELKVMHRKSCGDEPNVRSEFQKMSDNGKIPSQDDIDRISKVTMDAPILSSDTDMNSLGKRTLDSLMEIERKRMEMLEEQGCQVIENEREKIEALKRRAQDETKKLWHERNSTKTPDSDRCHPPSREPDGRGDRCQLSSEPDGRGDRCQPSNGQSRDFDRSDSCYSNVLEDTPNDDAFNVTGSTMFEESSGFLSSSIEELQVRNSRTESTEDEKHSDDSRPLSHASDFSRDNILSLSNAPRRSSRRGTTSEWQRPLTRYLPVDRDDFDLRTHVESAGHQIELCPYVTVNSSSCRGYLHKLGAKFHTWSKRWFVFDRETKTLVYYWDKTEKKPRGGAYFQVIEEVYLDHGNTSKSPNPQTTFIVKTRQRRYYLMAPSGEAARIWIDVIFTGAQGYTEYLE